MGLYTSRYSQVNNVLPQAEKITAVPTKLEVCPSQNKELKRLESSVRMFDLMLMQVIHVLAPVMFIR